jgi:hypothetical protein
MCLGNVHQKCDPGPGSEVSHHGLIRVLLIGDILKLWNNLSPLLSISLVVPLYQFAIFMMFCGSFMETKNEKNENAGCFGNIFKFVRKRRTSI